jgi:integrase
VKRFARKRPASCDDRLSFALLSPSVWPIPLRLSPEDVQPCACLGDVRENQSLSKAEDGDNAVKLLKEPKGRLRFLDPEEEDSLLEAAREPLRTIILLGSSTGLRIQSEALTLRWQDVDFRRGLITVLAAYAKNGQTRSVPMSRELGDALRRLRETAAGDHVFVSRKRKPFKSIRTAFETACKRAELTDVSPHVLRHTFASRLAIARYDLRTIQELGGWEEIEMVSRYAHLSPSHKAEERINRKNFPTLFTTAAVSGIAR